MTSVAQRFRGKEATEYEPQTWSGEKGSELITAFQMELQNWVGSLRDNMRKVHVAEARKDRLMEYKNVIHTCVHGHQECKSVTRKRLYQVAVSRTKREAKSDVATLRSRFKETNGRHFDPRTGADRSGLWSVCVLNPSSPPKKNVSLRPPPPQMSLTIDLLHVKNNAGAFVLAPASFLTFGKVNPGPLRLTFFFGRGSLPHPLPPHFCQRRPPPSD